jgi:molybdopterin-guanine dinucleotide biosynthesis protein A
MTAAPSAGRTVAVVLCGGRASRMGGGDKCLERLGASTLLETALARLRPQVERMAISANGDPARFAAFGLPVLADPMPDHPGPLAGVLAGLAWAEEAGDADALLTTAGDTPFLPADLAARLRGARGDDAGTIAVAASVGRRHPVIALWPVALADVLRRHLAGPSSRSVSAFQDRYHVVEAAFDDATSAGRTIDPFFNVNTRADLAEAERLIGEGRA